MLQLMTTIFKSLELFDMFVEDESVIGIGPPFNFEGCLLWRGITIEKSRPWKIEGSYLLQSMSKK